MADVEMPDAAADTASANAKAPTKAPKPGAADAGADNKKKFEVKKVRRAPSDKSGAIVTHLSGTPSLSGLGTLWSTTAPFAETTSWTYASNVKPTKEPRPRKSAPWLGVSVITPSISTASRGG